MAEFAGAFGLPHTPLLWRLLERDTPEDLAEVARQFDASRAALAEVEPDVVVMVASDHFHEFSHANMPAFSVGKAHRVRGTHPNEMRSFGVPVVEMPGAPAVAESIIGRRHLSGGFDFAFSNAPRVDHAFVVPLLFVRPEMDLPIVPIHTNTGAPPLPPVSRFIQLGRHLRAAIDAHPEPIRVALLASGHLSFELGSPGMFSGSSNDPEFDALAVELVGSGSLEVAESDFGFERLLEAGNLTFQVLNFLTLAAAAGRPADHAEGVACRFGHEPFFTWKGGGG